MPFLDASALETDPEGAAFLLAVFRWRPDPNRGTVGAQLGLPLGPHSIRFNRGLAANARSRRSAARNAGFRLPRQGSLRLSHSGPYRVTVKAAART